MNYDANAERGSRTYCLKCKPATQVPLTTQAPPPASTDLATIIANAVQTHIKPTLDESAVADIAHRVITNYMEEHPQQATAQEIKILTPNLETKSLGVQHKKFPTILKALQATRRVWICGPAGSGKTTIAKKCAEALSLPFQFNGAIDNEYKLSGFVDAQGRIVSTAFKEAFTKGGVYLFDEVDSSSPSATLTFQAALSNNMADFPGSGYTEAHPDFYCIACANTWGLGGNDQYVGRNRLDAAFLDRFIQIEVDYDEALELALCAGNTTWCLMVQRIRAKARDKGLRVVVSPRASLYGCQLFSAGFSEAEVMNMTIRKGMSDSQYETITDGIKPKYVPNTAVDA
jgi:cobaltochelatase CobS